jgi:sodium transport system permease protein
VLVIPEDYAERLQAGHPAPIELILDTSRQSAFADMERARNLLNAYSSTVSMLRLQARGIDPAVLTPVQVMTRDVSTPQAQTLIFLSMLPFLVTMTVFTGGMYVIIDTTAGERERGSLEPLLINPVPRWKMVIGKLLASLPFAVASLVLTLVLLYVAFQLIPFEEVVGFSLELSSRAVWSIFLLALPVLLIASAVQMLVATFTKSFKEAQTYLGFLPLIAGLPSMFLAFLPVNPNRINMLIPAYSQSLLMDQILRGETVVNADVVMSVVSTLVLFVVALLASIRLYQGERVLIGR